MGISFIPLLVVTMVSIIIGSYGCAVGKRSTTGGDIANNIDYPDYSPKYDESYPVVPKRAALLFDQLMVALQKAVSNPGKGSVGGKGISKSVAHRFPAANSEFVPVADDQMVANSINHVRVSPRFQMDLQRRGQDKSEFFWTCFVNALACFKKK
ncbi:PREDICTED: uncharacterized protein LOC105565959 [Vollenhovia emeryi]|uniref:uncharacterized protein LOC105565959 n=1 Tax=Vollenhovia emeryi TaxID=411798 RepID=UPI0005F4E22F|nr:PREDICTED: uncharacterized protein LOC105565959 [Vollenhovia emeryi]